MHPDPGHNYITCAKLTTNHQHRSTPTTMASLCFVLSKSSPYYTYIGVHEITASAILSDLTQAAQKIASVSHGWEPTNVKIELYEVLLNLMFCGSF